MSNITKKALMESLKKLMLQKPLNKITINDLTTDCGISRMAFYYHFRDIYDLVEWACLEESTKALQGKKTYETWQEGLLQIFEAVYENKPFIINAYHAVSREQIRKDEESGAITYLGYTTEPTKLMGRPCISLLLSSYHEGLNRSLMEGCALGKPIIASDIPGCRETVREGENGYLVPTKDVNALADAMLRYLSLSDEEKESMSINSRRLAEERFDIKYVKSCYERILQEYDS